MSKYVYAAARAAMLAFAILMVMTIGVKLAGDALSGSIWHTVLRSIEVLAWILYSFRVAYRAEAMSEPVAYQTGAGE